LNISEYEQRVRKTWFDPEIGELMGDYLFLATQLASEAGEVGDIFTKEAKRQTNLTFEQIRERLIDELGDVQWSLTKIAAEFSITMDEITTRNIQKLEIKYADKLRSR
jgi:NTP pyrophosphatase (non-canonical NTP hydrolase)